MKCRYALRRRHSVQKTAGLDPVSAFGALYGGANAFSTILPQLTPDVLQAVLDPASRVMDGLTGSHIIQSGIGGVLASHLYPMQNAALAKLPSTRKFSQNLGENFAGEAFRRGLAGKAGLDLGRKTRAGAVARFANDHITRPVYGADLNALQHVHATGAMIRQKMPNTAAWLQQHPEKAADFIKSLEDKNLLPTGFDGQEMTLSGALRSGQKKGFYSTLARVGLSHPSEWFGRGRQGGRAVAASQPAAAPVAQAVGAAVAPQPARPDGGTAFRDYVKSVTEARTQKNRPTPSAFYGSGVPA